MKTIFITYINRSGSTWLASLLSRYPEVIVYPEADILAKELLLRPGEDITEKEFLSKISGDRRMGDWELSASGMDTLRFPVKRYELFRHITSIYRKKHKPGASVEVFKAVEILDACRALEVNPDLPGSEGSKAIFISLIRDPRAVFASQKATRYRGRAMNSNPLITAYQWKYHVNRSRDLRKDGLIKLLKYEELLSDPESLVSEVLELAGITSLPDMGSAEGDLFERLSPEQQAIHRSITQKPLKDSADKWKRELVSIPLFLIEKTCPEEMKSLGYKLSGKNPGTLLNTAARLYFKFLIFFGISRY